MTIDPNLRAIATAAQSEAPGPWTIGSFPSDCRDYILDERGSVVIVMNDGVELAVAEHIAACSPSTVLALLDENKWLRALVVEACDVGEVIVNAVRHLVHADSSAFSEGELNRIRLLATRPAGPAPSCSCPCDACWHCMKTDKYAARELATPREGEKQA